MGVVLVLTVTGRAAWPWLVAVGPAPALVDWAATTFTDRPGSNAVRTATGALLGLGYGIAVPWLLTERPLWLFGVAAVYGGAAATLLARTRRREEDSDDTDGNGQAHSSHGP